MKKFKCVMCGEEFESSYPEAEALKELKEKHGLDSAAGCGIVCDDCHKKMMKKVDAIMGKVEENFMDHGDVKKVTVKFEDGTKKKVEKGLIMDFRGLGRAELIRTDMLNLDDEDLVGIIKLLADAANKKGMNIEVNFDKCENCDDREECDKRLV